MTDQPGVTAIIPVKPWALSKSRLDVGDAARESLARAFALDVIDVVTASMLVGRVVLVTAEAELRTVASRSGAVVLPDRPLLSADALNTAIDFGRRWAIMMRPSSPVVVVPADLPTLTTAILDDTLALLSRRSAAFVPDASGFGTSLLAVQSAHTLHTAYGENSAYRHSASGFYPVADADLRARRDVDTSDDLAEARLLGLGPRTTDAVNELLRARTGGRA